MQRPPPAARFIAALVTSCAGIRTATTRTSRQGACLPHALSNCNIEFRRCRSAPRSRTRSKWRRWTTLCRELLQLLPLHMLYELLPLHGLFVMIVLVLAVLAVTDMTATTHTMCRPTRASSRCLSAASTAAAAGAAAAAGWPVAPHITRHSSLYSCFPPPAALLFHLFA